MTWARLDDQFHSHPKIRRAWRGHPRALGLHVLALSYCADQLTDGIVDDEFVTEKIPHARERDLVTTCLELAGLWNRVQNGFRINDWHDFNPSRAEVLDRRNRDAERKRAGRSARSPENVRADSDRNPIDASRARPRPDPTQPLKAPHSPPNGGKGTGRDRRGKATAGRRQATQLAEAARRRQADADLVASVFPECVVGGEPASAVVGMVGTRQHRGRPLRDMPALELRALLFQQFPEWTDGEAA